MIRELALLAVSAAVLAGCNKTEFETAPVALDTPQGEVICQLYRRDMVMWDRALSRPAAMSDATASQLCIDEGRRQEAGDTERASSTIPDPAPDAEL